MPVTKTAKRALRSSKRKESVNKKTKAAFEIAIRTAKVEKTANALQKAISLVDRAAKKGILHKNKAARLKSTLSKLSKPANKAKTTKTKKTKK